MPWKDIASMQQRVRNVLFRALYPGRKYVETKGEISANREHKQNSILPEAEGYGNHHSGTHGQY